MLLEGGFGTVASVGGQDVIFCDEETGVGSNDAVAHTQLHHTVDQLFVLAIQTDAIEQITDAAGCPKASDEGFTQNFPAIREVRGVGAMLAMELADDQVTKRVLAEALARGLILLSAGTHGNVVRFLPALTISNVEVVEAMAILADALIAAKV